MLGRPMASTIRRMSATPQARWILAVPSDSAKSTTRIVRVSADFDAAISKTVTVVM